MGAAGAASGDKVYVDDVFDNYSFDGNGSNRSIVNGIDLATEGGLVWVKRWDGSQQHVLQDTERGTSVALTTASAGGNSSAGTTRVRAFNSNGFDLGTDSEVNASNQSYHAWTFRKSPGFFDVVTYNGNGSGSGQVINHSLGSVPGMIWVKRTTAGTSENWCVYHKSAGNNWYFKLDQDYAGWAQNKITGGSSTSFQVMDADAMINGSGDTYVAYIFGDDDSAASIYGKSGNEAIIKCGSFEATDNTVIECGFEPQHIFVKRIDGNTESATYNHMREILAVNDVNNRYMRPGNSDGEAENRNIHLTSTGFKVSTSTAFGNDTHVYMAIRRPNKPPTVGTQVYETLSYTGNGSGRSLTTALDRVDMFFTQRTNGGTPYALDRLRRLHTYNSTSSASEEGVQNSCVTNAPNKALVVNDAPLTNSNGDVYALTLFKRAPGFFDVVCYEGNGSNRTLNHNLGAVPEMMWVKTRTGTADNWQIYHSALGNTKFVELNRNNIASTGSSRWNNTTPTSTVFTVGTDTGTNDSSRRYFAYLFATSPGISKVGSYTGNNGYAVNVNCGFASGARYILIKNSDGQDSHDSWYVFNTVRGLGSGNDKYMWLNSSTAEVTNTNYIDALSTGFTINSSAPEGLNQTGNTYLFFAIA